jgi:hypothetical protein
VSELHWDDTEFTYRKLKLCAYRDKVRLSIFCYLLAVSTLFILVFVILTFFLIAWQFYKQQPTNFWPLIGSLPILLGLLGAYFKVAPCQDKLEFCTQELDRLELEGRRAHVRQIYEHYQSTDCAALVTTALRDLKPVLPKTLG